MRLSNAIEYLFLIIIILILVFKAQGSPLRFHPVLPETAKPSNAQISDSVDPNSGFTLAGPASPLAANEVVPFVKALHIHGISYEQARQFGPEAVPILLDLLADPENTPYKTNIVVTLGFLGDTRARLPLIDYLTQTQGEVTLSEFRGLSAVPFALAQLAHQGDPSSLDFLLEASHQTYWDNQTLPWTYNNKSYALEMHDNSLLALGVSGQPQAQARLAEVANQGGIGALEEKDVLQQALELNQRVQRDGMASVVSPDPNTTPPADMQDAIGSQASDPNPDTHIQTFTVARHVTETGLTTDAQVDAILAEATKIMRTADSSVDIACCVILQRSNSVGTFSVTDGTINTRPEQDAIFGIKSHQVKVVPTLDYCWGYNPSIIGCAYRNSPKNMIVEYWSRLTLDGILWAHEFGHNQGLTHPSPGDSTRIMNAALSLSGTQMTYSECTAWHSTSRNPGTIGGSCPLVSPPPDSPFEGAFKYYLPLIYKTD